jgi:hypothetical protein
LWTSISPVISVTFDRRKYVEIPNALPVRRLQSAQWQTACILGAPLTEIDAAPQKHCAIRVMV